MMAFLAAGGLEAVKPESLQTSKPVQPLELETKLRECPDHWIATLGP
jgi:hypothetical protein